VKNAGARVYDHDMLGEQEEPRRNRTEALTAAERASSRSAAVVHGELTRGLNSLVSIASTAPWLGLYGTVLGMNASFPGVNGSKESIMASMFEGLSEAFVPCAFGLMTALAAIWFYKYLLTEVEALDSEMQNASLQLINDLGHLRSN
jgi:biopolymer transport protein ExbB/TolQ